MTRYVERLAARAAEVDSLVCVGLDPDFKRHRIEDVASYNRAIIAATAPYVACYKPNVAFYEQWGIPGLRALEQTLDAIPRGIPVIGDAKRGDIGNSAEAYARSLFEVWNFDAVTVNAYQGIDAVAPFIAYAGRGVYILCRTSNKSSAEFQERRLDDGRQLFEEMALTGTSWSENVGLVVGATAPAELRRVRELVPGATLLVPGVGAQGGDPTAVIHAAGGAYGSIVVSSTRAILYASSESDFEQAAADAARALRDELRAASKAPASG